MNLWICHRHNRLDLKYGCPDCHREAIQKVVTVGLSRLATTYKEEDMKTITKATAVKTKAVAKSTVKKPSTAQKPDNHNKRWDPAHDHLLVLEFAKGTPGKQIGKLLGRTEVSIYGRLATQGLVFFNKEEQAYFTAPIKLYQF